MSDDVSSSNGDGGPTTTEDFTTEEDSSSLLDIGGGGPITPDGVEMVEDYFAHSAAADISTSDVSSFEEIDAQELTANDTVGEFLLLWSFFQLLLASSKDHHLQVQLRVED